MVRNNSRPLFYQLSNLSGKMIFPILSAESSQQYVYWPRLDMLNAKPITLANDSQEAPKARIRYPPLELGDEIIPLK